MRVALLVALVLGLLAGAVSEARAERRVIVETTPLALVFRGAGLGARVIPDAAPRWSFGGGAYAFTLPAVFVDQIPGNADEGWRVAIRPAVYASADRHLRPGGAGFGLGASLVLARFAIGNDATSDEAAFTSLYLVPRVSYSWFVLRDVLIQPSIGVELHWKLGGATTLAGNEFAPPRIQPSPGLMIGYRF